VHYGDKFVEIGIHRINLLKEKITNKITTNVELEFYTCIAHKIYLCFRSECIKGGEKFKAEFDKINSGMEEFNTKMKEISDARQEKAKKQKKIYK
jgi:hypothetical protein